MPSVATAVRDAPTSLYSGPPLDALKGAHELSIYDLPRTGT